jgi:hypothetical protein
MREGWPRVTGGGERRHMPRGQDAEAVVAYEKALAIYETLDDLTRRTTLDSAYGASPVSAVLTSRTAR